MRVRRIIALAISSLAIVPFNVRAEGPAALVPCATKPDAAYPLLVGIGYGVYNGVYNSTTGLNVWKGIRFAASTSGSNRWQPPQPPGINRTIVQATTFGPKCPQAPPSVPTASFNPGDEDCLFLNIYAPVLRRNQSVPVMTWIHPGGYGLLDGTQDMSEIINANGNGFMAVSIQYRLGAFGFLSSAEVKRKGVVNAGLLDQSFAFDWVQKHISKFGGDPNKVTIAGESAGAGSVMLHAMAANGALGSKVWQNGIAASPYSPAQYNYDDVWPTQRYHDFAEQAGCGSSAAVFDCLVSKESLTLQYASSNMLTIWPRVFLPVTDGTFITALPSVQLSQRRVNGQRMLNNANEGPLFDILDAYPTSSAPTDSNALKMETNGYGPPYAINNILAEATFVCPSYWMATAFTAPNKQAYHYQYSVPFAAHRTDVTACVGPATPNQGPEFALAIRKIWGNFIMNNNPSIPNAVANGSSSPNPTVSNPGSCWPAWTDSNPQLINLNETGGVPYQTVFGTAPVTQYMNPGLRNNFTRANAAKWELNRGQRCDFWKSMGPNVPQ
ncbi:alpha/beta-hydrolase [Parachaetomium inaequale]|uniref:Carboxylic ester hydrolase n=1 Tax=Parachaetomium inaequale TaxID=2588326 RepID=A0AAN6PA08_9PEZI|nr:alpha/beta-hydrolase [Parachaetomium inaequale]